MAKKSAPSALLKANFSVVNLSRGGRSSQSFRDEGRWQKTLDLRPDSVLIQFGHNDQPGHGPERETDAATTYRHNIARYVEEARAAGITPILVTPMTRREFDTAGKIRSSLAPYADAVIGVAREKKVPLVDLHARWRAFFEKTGAEPSKVLAPVKATGVSDGTHLNARGSAAIAPLVVDELTGRGRIETRSSHFGGEFQKRALNGSAFRVAPPNFRQTGVFSL